MARVARYTSKCNIYHVVLKGIDGEKIFESEHLKNKYIELLKDYEDEDFIKVLAYCFMSNHAHLLFYVKENENLSELMQKTNGYFATIYNRLNNRRGYVFENRFYSEPIKDRKHLYFCLAYIHYNPVKACMVENVYDYKYSSYHEYVSKFDFVSKDAPKIIFNDTLKYMDTFRKIHDRASKINIIKLFLQNVKFLKNGSAIMINPIIYELESKFNINDNAKMW